MALHPKTARTQHGRKCKNEFCSSRTELNGMFACIRRRQIVTANEDRRGVRHVKLLFLRNVASCGVTPVGKIAILTTIKSTVLNL